jgi:hypothetical protein
MHSDAQAGPGTSEPSCAFDRGLAQAVTVESVPGRLAFRAMASASLYSPPRDVSHALRRHRYFVSLSSEGVRQVENVPLLAADIRREELGPAGCASASSGQCYGILYGLERMQGNTKPG